MGYLGVAMLSLNCIFPSAFLIELCFHLVNYPSHGHALHGSMAISFPLAVTSVGMTIQCNYGQGDVRRSVLGASGKGFLIVKRRQTQGWKVCSSGHHCVWM